MSKKFGQAGILSIALLVPVLVFLTLKFFGKNRFDLPYYMPELDEQGQIKQINGDTVFHRIPEFTLWDQDSLKVSSEAFSEDIKVVNFFFSRCHTICPVINKRLARIQKNLKTENNVHFFSITVDPEFDKSQQLKSYAAHMGASPNWKFLTGDKAYIYELAIYGMKLPVSEASTYDSTIADIDEAFIHSDKILLIDPENFIRGIYEGTDDAEMKRLQLEIKVLLNKLKNEGTKVDSND